MRNPSGERAAALRAAVCAMAVAALLFTGGAGMPAQAADALGTKPVTIIIPLAAGGPNDVEARIYAARLTALFNGQQFLIDYKPGASGTIGAAWVARAAPDGHTLFLTGGSFSALPALFKELAFDPQRDFAHVALMSIKHFVLVVHPSFPVTSLAEYVSWTRANPEKANFATTGAGGSVHLGGAWLHNLINTRVTFVHYKGTAPAATDLTGGRVQIGAFGLQPALPLIKAGKLRALALMGSRRSDLVAGLPTIGESVPGYSFESYIGFSAPGGTPEPVVRQLNEAMVKTIRTPEVVRALEAQGSVPVGSSPAEFAKMLQNETARWRKVVQDNAISLVE